MRRKTVLVAVLKNPRDRRILLREKWYRIPLAFLPKRKFTHIAFYQPEAFGRGGKCIRYCARVAKRDIKRRIELLPEETEHPRAHNDYLKCSFRKIEKLPRPIKNIIPRRVSFGFTDLATLRSARDILELYHIPPTEQIIERRLARLNIPFVSQFFVIPARFAGAGARRAKAGIPSSSPPFLTASRRSFERSGRRGLRGGYRLDLAVFCKRGAIAIECDNKKAHAGKRARQRDRAKDTALRRLGWRVIRLSESDIIERLDSCVSRIQKIIRSLGGVRV